jgi:hypothetical protein
MGSWSLKSVKNASPVKKIRLSTSSDQTQVDEHHCPTVFTDHAENIQELYYFQSVLGTWYKGVVRKAVEKKTGHPFVIRSVKRERY